MSRQHHTNPLFCTEATARIVSNLNRRPPNRTIDFEKMRFIPGTWLAYILLLIPTSVALASNPGRARRLGFQRIVGRVTHGGSLTQRAADIETVKNQMIYSNDDIIETLSGAIAVRFKSVVQTSTCRYADDD